MEDNSKELQQLKSLLEGKTIAKIEPPNASEAICKFVLTDGTAFRLHATELGFWIEHTVVENQLYKSLSDLAEDYYEMGLTDFPEINVIDNIIYVKSDTGKILKGDISNFDDFEKQICKDRIGLKVLSEAMPEQGSFWKAYFNQRFFPNLPNELVYSPKQSD